jgi:hypothetical protein
LLDLDATKREAHEAGNANIAMLAGLAQALSRARNRAARGVADTPARAVASARMSGDDSSPEALIAFAREVIAGLKKSSEDVGLAASALEVAIEELEKALQKAHGTTGPA